MIFRAKLSRGGERFNDAENGKPVYEWYDQRGYVYLGQKRFGKMIFFSHENIERLPTRQQRRAAIKQVNKRLEKKSQEEKNKRSMRGEWNKEKRMAFIIWIALIYLLLIILNWIVL